MGKTSRERAVRSKTVTVRYKTPSRKPISVTVSQAKDELGNWLMPIILWNGSTAVILESARYAEDVGKALIVGAYFADEYSLVVKKNASTVLHEENEIEIEEIGDE